jgi:glycosyltransferase involved in cell wall biosynthesis
MGCGTEGFVALRGVLPGATPIVANLDDLEDRKISSHRAATASTDTAIDRRRSADMVRRALSGAVAEVDIRRWRSLHRSLGASVDRVVVCSEVDRGALVELGIDNCVVIENCYPGPVSAPGPSQVGAHPTLTMIGTLHYPPNADAARLMARRILPEVRRVLPAAQLRLVGKLGPQVADLADEPGVVATDVVDDLGPELRRADVAVVPIRFGSGTRIKILEAFAHRIPVVSTTIGAEGLDVEHGRELLLADDPEEFASACVRALVEPALRARLAAAGHARWVLQHRAEDFRARVVGLATELATSPDDRERPPPQEAATGGMP